MPRRNWIEAGFAIALLALFRLWSPPDTPAFDLCGFHRLTGLLCPLCGMTRGLCAAAKGEWARAIGFHALSPAVLIAIAGWPAFRLAGERGGPLARLRAVRWEAPAAAIMLAYGVLRILPALGHTL